MSRISARRANACRWQEMGRLIGYRLRPGVAAETLLAFTFETPPTPPPAAKPEPGMFVTGVPAQVTVAAGLAVRSVPAPGRNAAGVRNRRSIHGAAHLECAATVDVGSRAAGEWRDVHFSSRRRDGTQARRRVAHRRRRVPQRQQLQPLGFPHPGQRFDRRRERPHARELAAAAGLHRSAHGNQRERGGVRAAPACRGVRPQRAGVAHHDHGLPLGLRADVSARRDARPDSVPRRQSDQAEDWPRFEISRDDSSIDLDSVYSEMPSGSFVVLARGNFNYPAEPAPPDTYVELYTVTSVSEVSREEFARVGQGDAPRSLGRQLRQVPRRRARHQCVRPVRIVAARGIPGERCGGGRQHSRRRRAGGTRSRQAPAHSRQARQRRRSHHPWRHAGVGRIRGQRAKHSDYRSAAAGAIAPRLGGGARQRGAGDPRRNRVADPGCRQCGDAVSAFRTQAAAAHVSRRRERARRQSRTHRACRRHRLEIARQPVRRQHRATGSSRCRTTSRAATSSPSATDRAARGRRAA